MPDASLLPSNATELERDLSQSTDVLQRLPQAGQLLRTSKRQNIPDSVVPWLIYEYGLGEILPFLADPRTAISTGILWQRLRGTPESFRIALGWIGNDGTIEESEASTLRWAQFQLGLAQAPADLSQTDSVVELGRLSSPVRSSLFRIYGGFFDYRRFKLDDHLLSEGAWLCDHTGVYLKEEWPQLSFGRQHYADGEIDVLAGVSAETTSHTFHTDGNTYEDRMLLSNSLLDELLWRTWHLDVARAVVSRLHFTEAGPWWQRMLTWENYDWTQGLDWAGLVNVIAPAQKFCKAGLYLSDTDDALGDTNACFPTSIDVEIGDGPLLLSEGDPATGEGILSEHVARIARQEVLERIDRDHLAVELGPYTTVGGAIDAINREHKRILPYDDVFRLDQHLLSEHPFLATELGIHREHGVEDRFTTIHATHWATVNWEEGSTWAATNKLDQHRTQHRSHLYLSEDTFLDQTHAVLGWPTSERFERDHYAEATENRQGFTTRQHTRGVQVTWYRFNFQTWEQSTWAGDGAWAWLEGVEDQWTSGSWSSEAWWADAQESWSADEMWAKRVAWDPTSLTIESVHSTAP